MEKNLICSKCKMKYNFEVKQPRLFPNCGHTFCQECVQNLLNKKKYKCPIDNIKCDMVVIEKGIDYFPINLAIKNFIKTVLPSNSGLNSNEIDDSYDSEQIDLQSYFEDEDENEEQDKDSQEDFSQQNFCIHHHKKADLVCLTDRKLICSECVMFGIHKNHDYLKPEYFKQRAQKDLYDLREKAESINPNQLSEQILEQEKNHLISKVKYKKEMLSKEIEKNFQNLLSTLESKKKELKEDLNNHFTKFENSINYIHSNQSQIYIEEKELYQTFQSLENEIQKKYPNLNKILETLYGETSLLKQSQEINQKRNQQTQNTKKLIYENLNKIQLQGSFKKLIDEVRININLQTQNQIEQRNTLNERRQSSIDNQNINLIQNNKIEKKDSLMDNMLKLNQMEDNLYDDFEISQQEDQNKSQSNQQESMISGIINQNSQNNSINIRNNKEEEQNILESSIIDSPILINNNSKIEDEPNSFLKNNEVAKGFRKLSSIGRQPSNKLYQRKNSRKLFQMGSEQKLRQNQDIFQFNIDQQRKLSKDIPPSTFVQSNIGFYHHNKNALYNNRMNYNQQNNMLMTSETNMSKITQKQVRSNTQKKFGHKSQRNFYNPPSQQPRVIKRDFSGRGISESDLDIYIREVLEDPYIKILDLSNNKITTKGFKYLIQQLGQNKSIEFLDLKGNKIDDKAVIILEKYGKKLTTLKKINIQKNKITTSSILKKKYLDKLKKKGIKVNLIL